MSYTPEQLADAEQDRKIIYELCNKIPAGYQAWFYNRVIDFKEAVTEATRAANNRRSTPMSLREKRLALEYFYRD